MIKCFVVHFESLVKLFGLESNVVCLSHEGELKFHDVISTLRYCHDICPEAL